MDIDEALDDEHFISISLAGWQAVMGAPAEGHVHNATRHTADNGHETCDRACAVNAVDYVSFSSALGLFFLHYWPLPRPVEGAITASIRQYCWEVHFMVNMIIKLVLLFFN